MKKLNIKSEAEIAIMQEGGKRLHAIKNALAEMADVGISGWEIELMARKLIAKAGGKPSFSMVKGYNWATCINVNDVVVHGIPNKAKFKNGDIVSIDVGLYYRGYHTDTSVTVGIGTISSDSKNFLKVGQTALSKAIDCARVGNTINTISQAMEQGVLKHGFSPVKALTGHGIGTQLHEEPAIPCFVVPGSTSLKLIDGMVLAIEIMYNLGTSDVVYKNDDGWTIATADGKISGLFEETIVVTKGSPIVLT
jgi:methionyl aminopeptidase